MPLQSIIPSGTCFTAAVRGIVLRVEASGEKNGVREWFGRNEARWRHVRGHRLVPIASA